MLKKLSSPWIGSIIGLVCFLSVTAATWNAAVAKMATEGAQKPLEQQSPEADPRSWLFNNVEVEGLVKELREQRETMAKREKDLNEWAERLAAERTELNQLTQAVHRLQKEFDASVSKVAEEEVTNLRKLAKTYSSMEPDGAAGIFKQMDDLSVVRILMFMKDSETGPILASLSKLSEADAKRAGDLTDKLRLAVVPKKK